jgi:hypothetical protein
MQKDTVAYVVKPLELTVQRVRLSDYRDIYRAGGFDTFDCAYLNNQGDAAHVDGEGLFKPNPASNFFMIGDYPEPLCGNGVVLGCDREGESVAPSIP